MDHFSAMTFNVRTSLANDGPQGWDYRKKPVVRTILDHDPDLLGLQEPTERQWREIGEGLGPGWTGFSFSRRDRHGPEPHLQGGYFKPARFEKVADGCFWLSDTPDVPGSISFPLHWGARTAVWIRLRDRLADRELVFAVTHFDTHPDSWVPCARVLAGELTRHAGGLPVIVVGDFNCAAGSPAWKYLAEEAGFRDAWTEVGLPEAGALTYNAFTTERSIPFADPREARRRLDAINGDSPEFAHYTEHMLVHRNCRIDWIMIRGALRAVRAEADFRTEDGLLPSDHYPVIATIAPA